MNQQREAGIHIGESLLKQLISEWMDDNDMKLPSDDSMRSLVDYILLNGKKYTLSNRIKLDGYNGKVRRQAKAIEESPLDLARSFAGLWYNVRFAELHYRGTTRIREGSSDWLSLRELVPKAVAFSERFQLPIREGFLAFIRTFHKISGERTSIRGASSRFDSICNIYEATLDIAQDPTPLLTSEMHLLYSAEVSKRTGINISYESQPSKYVFFVYAKKLAGKYGLTLKQYVQAQFESLDWANGIPRPQDFVAVYSEERVIKWMAKNNIRKMVVSRPQQEATSFWAKIKSYEDNAQQ